MNTASQTAPDAAKADDSAAADDGDADYPEPEFSSISAREAANARQMLPPAQLKLTTGRFDFHLNVESKEIFNQIADRCGLQTVFDSEYATTPKIRFDINDVDCREALLRC